MTPPLDEAQVVATITALMPDWDADGIASINYLVGGYSNHNFRFAYNTKRYVVRVPYAKQPFIDRQHESAWYASLPTDVGVSPLAFDETTGCMITPWHDGELLIDSWETLNLTDLLDYLRQLHRVLPDNSRIYSLIALNEMYWDANAPLAPPSLNASTTCHNDLNPWNVLITPKGKWITLDWEFVGRNDPLFDLVALHQGLGLDDADLRPMAQSLTEEINVEDRLTAAYTGFWLREMGWAHHQLKQGHERSEIREQYETARTKLKLD